MGNKGIRSRKAKLVVFVPPQPPVIEEGSFLKTTSGAKEELTCVSDGGKPAAELYWLDGQGFEIKEGIQHIKSVREDGKTYNSKLKLTFIPSRVHHGTTLTCRSENPALKRSMLAKIHVEVRFPPNVRLIVKSGRIREFQDVGFQCLATANPKEVTYKWYKNGVPIIGDYTTEYILTSVSRKDNKVTVSCEVTNSIGSTTSMHVLDVHFRPIIQKKASYLTTDYKGSVTLKCPVSGNPKPLISWSHEDKIIFQGSKQNLVIKNMNKYKAGKYKCNATVPDFPSATQEYLVFIKGPPRIKSEARQTGVVGHTLKLECLVRSVPLPINVAWYYKSTLIDPYSESKYDLEEDTLADGVRNQLIIHRSTEDDFGRYNCSVTNGYDDLSEHIPWVGIIAGIVGGIVFIITASVIILFFLKYKKGKRKENLQIDLKHELPSSCKMQRNETEPKVMNDSYRNSTAREPSELNGYVPYSDYTRDFIPPHPDGIPHHLNNLREGIYGNDKVDPWFNAGYANPYLSRNSIIGPLGPPPHSILYRTVPGANSMTSPNYNDNNDNNNCQCIVKKPTYSCKQ
ncbi:Irregular chiasm C-roughest protein [Nymphon striatum]|nr:Irregular chiasm C-roughest protein [Nymphon striatum]